jgi:hypothetical protein
VALVLEGCVALAARTTAQVFGTTYIPYSRIIMILHLILAQVTLGKPLIMLMALLALDSKYNRM